MGLSQLAHGGAHRAGRCRDDHRLSGLGLTDAEQTKVGRMPGHACDADGRANRSVIGVDDGQGRVLGLARA